MESFSHYRLKPAEDGYQISLYLNENMEQFSTELGIREHPEQKKLEWDEGTLVPIFTERIVSMISDNRMFVEI